MKIRLLIPFLQHLSCQGYPGELELALDWLIAHGPQALFVLLVLGIVGLPVPDEALLTFSGYLIASGRMRLLAAFAAALSGSMCGITISYWIGRSAGHAFLMRYGPRVGLTEARWRFVENWFEHIGHWALTFGYYIAGVRHFTAVVAGSTEVPYRHFAAYAYAGALLWVSTFLTLGYYLGENWKTVLDYFHHASVALAIVVVVGALAWWLWRRRATR